MEESRKSRASLLSRRSRASQGMELEEMEETEVKEETEVQDEESTVFETAPSSVAHDDCKKCPNELRELNNRGICIVVLSVVFILLATFDSYMVWLIFGCGTGEAPPDPQGPLCPEEIRKNYTRTARLENDCFIFLLDEKLKYKQAHQRCRSLNGSLAMPKTQQMNTFLVKQLTDVYKQDSGTWWIGLDDSKALCPNRETWSYHHNIKKCFRLVIELEIPYKQAQDYCQHYPYGNMAMIKSRDEYYAMNLTVQKIEKKTGNKYHNGFRIGGDDEKKAGTYVWLDGEEFGWTKWAKGQPMTANSRKCIVVVHATLAYTSRDGGMYTVSCPKKFIFLCETLVHATSPFSWMDGTELNETKFSNWSEPDAGKYQTSKEKCVAMDTTGVWTNKICDTTETPSPYICQLSMSAQDVLPPITTPLPPRGCKLVCKRPVDCDLMVDEWAQDENGCNICVCIVSRK